MHKNKIWLAFLALITLVVAWFIWGTVDKLRDYAAFTRASKTADIEWSVYSDSQNTYYLKGIFSFVDKAKKYSGETILFHESYSNPSAAERAIPQHIANNWKVWYDPDNPKNATLVKKFPTKELISTAILVGLWIYFIWLGFYVTQFTKGNKIR